MNTTMRKFSYLLTVILMTLAGLGLTACGGGDDDSPTTPKVPVSSDGGGDVTTVDIVAAMVGNTWYSEEDKISSYYIEGYTFNANGTGTVQELRCSDVDAYTQIRTKTYQIRWEISDNILTSRGDDGIYASGPVVMMSDSEARYKGMSIKRLVAGQTLEQKMEEIAANKRRDYKFTDNQSIPEQIVDNPAKYGFTETTVTKYAYNVNTKAGGMERIIVWTNSKGFFVAGYDSWHRVYYEWRYWSDFTYVYNLEGKTAGVLEASAKMGHAIISLGDTNIWIANSADIEVQKVLFGPEFENTLTASSNASPYNSSFGYSFGGMAGLNVFVPNYQLNLIGYTSTDSWLRVSGIRSVPYNDSGYTGVLIDWAVTANYSSQRTGKIYISVYADGRTYNGTITVTQDGVSGGSSGGGSGGGGSSDDTSGYTITRTSVCSIFIPTNSSTGSQYTNSWYKWESNGRVILSKSRTDKDMWLGVAQNNNDSSRGGHSVSSYKYRYVDNSVVGGTWYYYFD